MALRTGNDCLVCFLRQALATARLAGQDPAGQRRVVVAVAGLLPLLDQELSPPENAIRVYGEIARLTGVEDPYAGLKAASTRLALQLLDNARQRIATAIDPLYSACRYAIAANVIDYGTPLAVEAGKTLDGCLQARLAIDDYRCLQAALARRPGAEVLYLADNCGEILFDGLVVEQLQRAGCRVTLAVRGGIILNDATRGDAEPCRLQCRVIDSGLACPGTPLGSCSPELEEAFGAADLVISKGQGNFETLADSAGPLFYLLTVKCPVVAGHIAGRRGLADAELGGRGEMVLLDGGRL